MMMMMMTVISNCFRSAIAVSIWNFQASNRMLLSIISKNLCKTYWVVYSYLSFYELFTASVLVGMAYLRPVNMHKFNTSLRLSRTNTGVVSYGYSWYFCQYMSGDFTAIPLRSAVIVAYWTADKLIALQWSWVDLWFPRDGSALFPLFSWIAWWPGTTTSFNCDDLGRASITHIVVHKTMDIALT